MGVNLIGLASSAAGDVFVDEGGHSRPPIIFLEKGDGAEVSAMGTCKGFVNIFYKGVLGRFGNVEGFVIEGALVKIPVFSLRTGKGDSVGVHRC